MSRHRLVPLLVSSPIFLQNLDTTGIVLALPSMARSLQVPTLHLNLAITAYLLSMAVFLPASGWLADRFGARRTFCTAIAVFSAGSVLCGLSTSLEMLVTCRLLQGLGAAMMVPVGRLIMLRTVPSSEMVGAMVWFTIPPLLGRMAGPLFVGAVLSVAPWPWLFYVSVPFGLLAILLALRFLDADEPGPRTPFDVTGFVLLALGLTAALGAVETAGKGLAPGWAPWLAGAAGALLLAAYVRHSRRCEHPIIDLAVLRVRSLRISLVGGLPLHVAIQTAPFLLPLLLQLGFGMAPLQAGALTIATALGALSTRVFMKQLLERLGMRTYLLLAGSATLAVLMSYGLMSAATPHWLMFALMFAGGLFASLCTVMLHGVGYTEVPRPRMTHATALVSVSVQLWQGLAVLLASAALPLVSLLQGGDGLQLQARDFPLSFVLMGLLGALSLAWFWRQDFPEVGKKPAA